MYFINKREINLVPKNNINEDKNCKKNKVSMKNQLGFRGKIKISV